MVETYSEFICTPNGNGPARCHAKYDVAYDADRRTFVYRLVPFSMEIIEQLGHTISDEKPHRRDNVAVMSYRNAA